MKFRVFLVTLLASLLIAAIPSARSADAWEEHSSLTRDPSTGVFTFSWSGHVGRTYFIQQSEDMVHWTYLPLIEPGADQTIEWAFTSNAGRCFVRLKYSTQSTTDPLDDDFDGDGVSNYEELVHGLDPLTPPSQVFDPANGLPLDWERYYLGHTGGAATADDDLDGYSNLYEYQHHTNPADFYNGQTPSLTPVSGNNQAANPQTLLPQPLIVQVKNAGGSVLTNAPVTFTAAAGGGSLRLTSNGSNAANITARTDSQGRVQVYFLLPDTSNQECQVYATAGLPKHAARVIFKENTSVGSVPPAPSNLVATPLSKSWIGLTWNDNSSNETGFKIERKASAGGSYSVVKTVGKNITHVTDVSLPANTGFSYRVTALSNAGSSAASNASTATTQAGVGGGGGVAATDDPAADPDQDGLTNQEEIAAGTDPMNADSDNDGVLDGQDGWANDKDLSPPRLPELSYALIDLGIGYGSYLQRVALNNKGQATFGTGNGSAVWNGTSLIFLGNVTATGINDQGVISGYEDVPYSNPPNDYLTKAFLLTGNQKIYLTYAGIFPPSPSAQEGVSYAPWALGLNNNGGVVGISGESYVTETRAVYWGGGSPSSDLGNVPDANDHKYPPTNPNLPDSGADNTQGLDDSAWAESINDLGQIAGSTSEATTDGQYYPGEYEWDKTNYHAVYWPSGSSTEPISLGIGAAHGINNLGMIVGEDYSLSTSVTNMVSLPALWIPDGAGGYKQKTTTDGIALFLGSNIRTAINDRVEIAEGIFVNHNGKDEDLTNFFTAGDAGGTPKWSQITATSINNSGLVGGVANYNPTPDTPNTFGDSHAFILMPLKVDYLSRNPITGEFSTLGGQVSQSPPTPQVKLTVTNTTLTTGGDLNVTVQCVVRDELSEILSDRSKALQKLTFYINGEAVETVSNLANLASGGTVPVWQPYSSQVTLTRTFTVVQPQSGAQEIKAMTGLNAAGNQGRDTATVIITRPTTVFTTVAPTVPLTIRLTAPLSTTTADTIYVKFGANTEAALLESGVGNRYFTGTIQTDQGAKSIALWLGNSPALDSTKVEQFNASGQIAGANFMGVWQETSASSKTFAAQSSYQQDDTASSVPSIVGVFTGGGSPQGFLEPFVVRLTVPTEQAQWITSAGGPLKVQLFGQNVEVVQNDTFILGQTPPTGSTYLWIASSSVPRLFAIVTGASSSLTPPDALRSGGFKITTLFTGNGNTVPGFLSNPSVIFQPASGSSSSTVDGNTNAQSSPNTVDSTKFGEQTIAFYDVLFQGYGARLLTSYQNAGLQIQFVDFNDQSYNPLYRLKNHYLSNTTPDDQRTGKVPVLYINTRATNPVLAAQALFFGLNELKVWTIRDDLRLVSFQQALDDAVAGDPTNATIYQALYQVNIQPIAEAISDCSQAAEVGLSLIAEPAFLIFTTADIADSLQEGDYTKTGTIIAMAALPTVAKRCFAAGRPLVLRLGGGLQDLQLAGPVLQALASFTDKSLTRIQKMQILRPLLENGSVTKELIRQLYASGELKTPKLKLPYPPYQPGSPYAILRDELETLLGRQMNKDKEVAHHMLVLEHEVKFLEVGLDPNAGENGLFLAKEFHKRIHGKGSKGWPGGDIWNYQWDQFFAKPGAENYTAQDIITFRDKLKSIISDSSIDVEKMDWPFQKP